MSTIAAAPSSAPTSSKPSALEIIKPYTAPFYLAVAGLLGAITVVFVIVVTLIVLVATNFNVLSLIE
jgi:hypothetical protein